MPPLRKFGFFICRTRSDPYEEDHCDRDRHLETSTWGRPRKEGTAVLLKKYSLSKLAKSGRFDDICKILRYRNNEIVLAWLAEPETTKTWLAPFGRSFQKNNGASLGNALHVLVFHQPSAPTIWSLLQWVATNTPEWKIDEAVNSNGSTPLHVAVQRGCQVHVIEHLLYNPSGVTLSLSIKTLDNMKRCPLHWACCMKNVMTKDGKRRINESKACIAKSIAEFNENMYFVVSALTKAYPEAVRIEDVNQQTPVDLACANFVDKRILILLYNTCLELSRVRETSTEEVSDEMADENKRDWNEKSFEESMDERSLIKLYDTCCKMEDVSETERISSSSSDGELEASSPIPHQIGLENQGHFYACDFSDCSVASVSSRASKRSSKLVRRHHHRRYVDKDLSDTISAVSSLGDCGVSVYGAVGVAAVKHEHRTLVAL